MSDISQEFRDNFDELLNQAYDGNISEVERVLNHAIEHPTLGALTRERYAQTIKWSQQLIEEKKAEL